MRTIVRVLAAVLLSACAFDSGGLPGEEPAPDAGGEGATADASTPTDDVVPDAAAPAPEPDAAPDAHDDDDEEDDDDSSGPGNGNGHGNDPDDD